MHHIHQAAAAAAAAAAASIKLVLQPHPLPTHSTTHMFLSPDASIWHHHQHRRHPA
jgi:hypothetical protein